jgi:predicted restriction endonuclease
MSALRGSRHEPVGFLKSNGDPYVEAHHVMPVSRQEVGSLSASNIMTLCANHHRQLHYGGSISIAIGDAAFTVAINGITVEIPKVSLTVPQASGLTGPT